MVSIVGLNKADVLAALYNASRPPGLGFLHFNPKPMLREDAENLLQQTSYFDYLQGRVMKLSLQKNDEFDEWGYDRDNGPGAAQRAIDALRASNSSNAPEIQAAHVVGKTAAAESVMGRIDRDTTSEDHSGIAVTTLGMSDVADELIPAVDKAMKND